jgi:aryl-alcohol dehydrogenase-like predicted oxidoreductase
MWDFTVRPAEVMRALETLVRSGKILHVGISDAPAWVIAEANTVADFRGWSAFTAVQVPYSLARRDVEREILPMAKALDLAVTPWGILGGGVLTGKYREEDDTPKRLGPDAVQQKPLEAGDVVRGVARDVGRTPAQVALNWVRQQQHRATMVPILGARTEAQLRDNLAALEFTLAPEQLGKLDEAVAFEPGFPHDFITNPHVSQLVYGDNLQRLDHERPRRGGPHAVPDLPAQE